MTENSPAWEKNAPFPYFGGKRKIADFVWTRFGAVKEYLEPFCGSAAMLLLCPQPAPLEVAGDSNCFIANFWRAVKHQPEAVARHADYPVSHIDLHARHVWLHEQGARLRAELAIADWPGDAKVAGWWVWGQCNWIGSGWCAPEGKISPSSKVPTGSGSGKGLLCRGKVPRVDDCGQKLTAVIPANSSASANAGDQYLTSVGRVAHVWLKHLSARLERVRILHGDWTRCLNHSYGGDDTAVFLDPPYRGHESLYGNVAPTADAVAAWAKGNPNLRIALCGLAGDYDLPGWEVVRWSRDKPTYGGKSTTSQEAVWFSPACAHPPSKARGCARRRRK